MTTSTLPHVLLLAALVLSASWLTEGRREPARGSLTADTMLREWAGFTSDEVARITAGDAVARSLQADDDEVAVAGAVRMCVPSSFYLARFRAIETFKQDQAVLQIRRFSQRPSAADMTSLQLGRRDLDDLRSCAANGCRVKLDGAGLARFAAMRAAPGSDAQVSDAFIEHLAKYSARYLEEGNGQLIEYRDRGQPRALLGELREILRRSDHLADGFPSLTAAIGSFSGPMPASVDGFLYWSHEMVGPRPVVTITHSLITTPGNGVTAIASKQIYASHYFTASLGLTVLIDEPGATAPGTLVIYLNRSRVDFFDGLLGSPKRAIVRSRARSASARILRELKSRLEGQFLSPTTPNSHVPTPNGESREKVG